jgi:hypothetical protein
MRQGEMMKDKYTKIQDKGKLNTDLMEVKPILYKIIGYQDADLNFRAN